MDRLFALIIQKVTAALSAERTSLYVIDWEKRELWTKVAEKVREALSKGADFVSNPDNATETRGFIEKWTGLEPGVVERLRPPKYWKLDEVDRDAVQALADLLYEKGALDKRVDCSGLYYTRP